MISWGPEMPRGKVCEGTSILDLAPTILDHFGIKPPAHMDGRVLSELRSSTAEKTVRAESGNCEAKLPTV